MPYLVSDCDWRDISLSTSFEVHTSPYVDFKAIQTKCFELSGNVRDKAGVAFGLLLQGLDGLQESEEAKAQIAALQLSGP